ncbi:MAG TPA: hypothetical protein VJX23_03050 [Candidatus Binataceae bacterium]|nr:hypothetical protein [Candidatus Binataceae bacterium]
MKKPEPGSLQALAVDMIENLRFDEHSLLDAGLWSPQQYLQLREILKLFAQQLLDPLARCGCQFNMPKGTCTHCDNRGMTPPPA